jgi:hypothetical protein
VIISPDATTELEFDDCAVVLEHPARSTAAAATAANHAPEPLRIPENFDLMLSPLTGTEGRHVFRPSPLGMLSQASRLSKRYWMELQSLPRRVAGLFEGRHELPSFACGVLERRMAELRK